MANVIGSSVVPPTMAPLPLSSRMELAHHRLYEFAKKSLIKIFVSPYASVWSPLRSSLPFFCSFSSTGHFTAALSLFIVFLWLLEVCDLYCGGGADTDKWDEAQIGHYIGVGSCCVLIYDS